MSEIVTIILYIAIGLNICVFGLGATLANTDLMLVSLLSTASCLLAVSMRSSDDESE